MSDIKLHDRTLISTPDVDYRIAIGKEGYATANITFTELFAFLKSNISYDFNALEKDNTEAYTPTGDYNPATKKYVDDSIEPIESTKAETGTVNIGGVIVKWGRVSTDTNANITVSFEDEFPTACQNVSLVYYGGEDKGTASFLMVKSVTNSTLIISDGGGQDATHIMWQAIGY